MTMSATSVNETHQSVENITPHQVITLLLDGALERVDHAISRLGDGDIDEAAVLIQKTISIVGGLRENLNLDEGGEIAKNLDLLYEYIVTRLNAINEVEAPITVLDEVRKLLNEVHMGWVGIADSI